LARSVSPMFLLWRSRAAFACNDLASAARGAMAPHMLRHGVAALLAVALLAQAATDAVDLTSVDPAEEQLGVAPHFYIPTHGNKTDGAAHSSHLAFLPPSLGVPMAIVTGLFYAAAANIASYISTQDAKYHTKRSRAQQIAVEIVTLAGWSIGGTIITAAYASGCPVPVANATMVATNLVANMILQVALRITYYDKSMRIGTLIFAVAVYQLAYLGPAPHDEDMVLGEVLTKPPSFLWFMALLVAGLLSSASIVATLNAPHESYPKIVSWAVVISILGAGTDNAAACLGMLEGWLLFGSMFLYGCVALVLLILSAKAPAVCDAAMYVPLQLCIQMVINMFTGLIVWGDGKTIKSMPPYLATFGICVWSVYLASGNLDLFSGIHQRSMRNRPLSRSSLGNAVLKLLACWQQERANPPAQAEEDIAAALQHTLTTGLEQNTFSPADVARLAAELQRKLGHSSTPEVLRWIEDTPFFRQYVTGHPEFAKALECAALPPGGTPSTAEPSPGPVGGRDDTEELDG